MAAVNPEKNRSVTSGQFEAPTRFSLARLREYTEQVALLNGEEQNKTSLGNASGAR
jgi:ABC-type uncharacterized transport system fused permease/ATPase subunit